MPVTLRSYAKVNLGLAIGPARPDGFHALATLYQTLDAHDLLTVTVEREPGRAIVLTSNDKRVPLDERNTVWKMLTLALAPPDRAGLRARVHLEKRLPIQGGLGGGSGNAVAALIGLERELARKALAAPLSGAERLRLAAEVGSDVPLFLLGGAVLGLGRGEEVLPLSDLPELPVLLALPNAGVSTPAAFRAWDADQAESGLTPEAQARRLSELSRALASAWAGQHAAGVFSPRGEDLAGNLLSTLVQTGLLGNDFEQVVFRQNPSLGQIKRELDGHGALYASLSGSGSALFGVYPVPEAVRITERRLRSLGVRTLPAKLLGRSGYWSGMIVDEG